VEREPLPRLGGSVGVLCAGTSDLPVAEEAAVTLEIFGNQVERISDVGVAGVHRLIAARDRMEACNVLIVVAGMEGALPSAVAGLVSKPVIAVPTSVGYGASFGGLAALLGMLNSCGSGVTVVNIDNGFGAAYAAATINRQIHEASRGASCRASQAVSLSVARASRSAFYLSMNSPLPLLAAWLLPLAALQAQSSTAAKSVTPEDAEKLLKEKKDVVVLDIRTAEEFKAGHIAGARNIDYLGDSFAKEVSALEKDKTYLVHCASGGRSAKAMKVFEEQKIPAVLHMDAGFKGWQAAGKPVEK
jgi:rhodanese-related sulfurtransferase/phosphoribosylcarboxyaminoimidazole (NCAIR) mutase